MKSNVFGTYKVDRILIPFEGKFVGTEKSPVITIFLGDKGYICGPLRNSHGLEALNKLKEEVDKYRANDNI